MTRLRWALLLNLAFLAGEVVAGIAFSSLALLADAVHMGSDVAALSIAMMAAGMARRPRSPRHSYGWARTEILAALGNSVMLMAVTAWVAVTAVHRLSSPVEVQGAGLTAVASGGLAVNLVSLAILLPRHKHDLNLRAAALHMAADAGGSVAAIVAGVAVLVTGDGWPDPLASLVISALVVLAAWRLVAEAVQVLMEGTPRGIDPHQVEEAVLAVSGVRGVHHLHVWTLGSGTLALSGHVMVAEGMSLHLAEEISEEVRALLSDRFGITHATLEMECHNCEVTTTVPLRARRAR